MTKGDQNIKATVVATLCAIAFSFAVTVCILALRQMPVPDALDRLSIFVLGGVAGLLAKTSTDKPQASGRPGDPVSVAQTAPVEMVNAPGDVIETKPAATLRERDGADYSNVS